MVRITIDLLRRRAEHNEGCLSDLVEIALHQQDIEKLEVVGDACRQLQILYLCNNYIPKIEGLFHLKQLTYLNLAVNSIKVIEGLEGCESLKRLDLTLNFITDMTCVSKLRANAFLDSLILTGNPCCETPGYRAFVIQELPHLNNLDGDDVVRSEKILARQDKHENAESVSEQALKWREEERIKKEMEAKGIDPFPPKYNEKGERVYGHSAEERLQMLRETEAEEQARKDKEKANRAADPNSISAVHDELKKKAVPLTPQEEIEKYGKIRQRNEGKLPFRWEDEKPGDEAIVLHVEPGKFISTTLINIEVEPTFVRVTVKGKVLQLETPQEVASEKVSVQRAQTNGALKITMPLAAHILQEQKIRKQRYAAAKEEVEGID